MVAGARIRGKSFAIGLLGIVALFAMSGSARAVFPPIYQQPTETVTQAPVTPATVDPPVIIVGEPEVIDPVVPTPEPATLVTGLMGLMLAGGFAWRKRRK